MKGILLLNGEPYSGEIKKDGALVICCDGAYAWAKDKIKPDMNVGDFDSLSEIPDPPPAEIYPKEKDFTDGEMAMHKLLSFGADEIEIYGGGGRREDHFMGNLQLLYLAHKNGAKCKMITNDSVIFLADGRIELGEYVGKTLSVLPFCAPLHIMESAGLKYSYPEVLNFGECRGISNICQSRTAYLAVEGVALVIINRGEV